MLKIYLFSLFLIATSCSCKKTALNDVDKNAANSIASSTEACPQQGICTLEILKNKSLSIKNSNNNLLYELNENAGTTVIHYQYARNMDDVAFDGGYREEIIFEIDSKLSILDLSNNQLQETKMLYGRYCHCRGNAGLFIVENGNLNLKKNKDEISFTLDYNTGKIPQEIKNIIVSKQKLISSK